MKKAIQLTFILTLLLHGLNAQIFNMQDTLITGICSGTFLDSDADSLLPGNAYANNEDFTMTFCSGSTEPITFFFGELDINSGDHLMIYDGPTTGSTLLMDVSNSNLSSVVITSSGTCITFHFTSDDSGSMPSPNGNWSATIFCGDIPECNPNAQATASDNCADAPTICDMSGYCGNTSSSYTPDTPGNMCQACGLFGGSLENNSWLKFVPDNDMAIFTIFVPSCTDNTGIQFGVYSSTGCDNFVLMTDASWTSSSAPISPGSTSTIFVTGLTPGQVYYIMIDGNAGDDCDYIIQAVSGLTPDFDLNLGADTTLCADQYLIVTATFDTSSVVDWYPSWITGDFAVLDTNVLGLGSYNISAVVTDGNGCITSDSIQVTFEICSGIPTIEDNIAEFINDFENQQFIILIPEETGNAGVEIYSRTGQLVSRQYISSGKTSISTLTLSNGLYIVRIISKKGEQTFVTVCK
ncbi:MAG: T9SS type A sorting domain-containing protein [Bacteroidetes bacterium]|nr:T9SS type A sorting domain-containing protein [Bacteroidota bacterium]